MRTLVSFLVLCVFCINGWAQETVITVKGKVLDKNTREALPNASVEIRPNSVQGITGFADGSFEFRIPSGAKHDTLIVSHVGYRDFKKIVSEIDGPMEILLGTFPIELRAVTITSRKLDLRDIDRGIRRIKDNLYAFETETTNGMYNLFLGYLEEHDQHELLKQCLHDLSSYDEETKAFYAKYAAPARGSSDKRDTVETDYTDFPVINIQHGAAVMYCQWLTEQYNSHSVKKKFKKVKFRLPTKNEWQIAALGYPKFQSWNLDENNLEVVIPDDTLSEVPKGKRITISAKEDFLYPWWNAYYLRNKPYNFRKCYMGNFKVPANAPHCEPVRPGLDGWTRQARTDSYFPNNMGLSDVVGNVAEMIDEKGKSYGGSWNDLPGNSTIRSVRIYRRPGDDVGFRVFMEVIE